MPARCSAAPTYAPMAPAPRTATFTASSVLVFKWYAAYSMRCSAKREVVSMDRLADWTRSASARLDIDAGQADAVEILELAREVRRAEGRTVAIVTAYLLGV